MNQSEFSNHEIEEILKSCKVKYHQVTDPSAGAAELLSDGKVIAWFQGRMEFGLRALGNRSILADPRHISMKDKVNLLVKKREAWRPFAPSVLEEAIPLYFDPVYHGQHITVSVIAKENIRDKIPAAIHIDGTARIQPVSKEKNEKYYALIKEFLRLTGVPVILNTSFNVRSNPVACTPIDALKNFYTSGLEALVIGDFVVLK
ncbi:MAG: carbamoyltransferase C-terminal domain-containing protein [Comamonas sp.]